MGEIGAVQPSWLLRHTDLSLSSQFIALLRNRGCRSHEMTSRRDSSGLSIADFSLARTEIFA